ncbi:branched-chain amino acid transporter permease [Propionibacterium australiense]|nr:AzlD domain-containing protein [Propionibacterium australiense]
MRWAGSDVHRCGEGAEPVSLGVQLPDAVGQGRRFMRGLAAAIFGMLVVYSLKDVSLVSDSHGVPEAIAIAVTVGLHLWRRQMLVFIAGGTIGYMLLVQFVF